MEESEPTLICLEVEHARTLYDFLMDLKTGWSRLGKLELGKEEEEALAALRRVLLEKDPF